MKNVMERILTDASAREASSVEKSVMLDAVVLDGWLD
jgi:hypothetical protein